MSRDVTAGAHEAPLEDLMVAMDVVDTIRHRQLIVERELNADGRRERLIERLREIYTQQGIEVTDAALEAGVDALEQARFAYTPTPGGFSLSYHPSFDTKRPTVAISQRLCSRLPFSAIRRDSLQAAHAPAASTRPPSASTRTKGSSFSTSPRWFSSSSSTFPISTRTA